MFDGDERPNATEAINVVAKANIGLPGILVIAIPATARLGVKAPRAAAKDFGLTGLRPFGVLLRGFLIIVHFVKVVAPFPHVSGHVAETPCVGQLLSHGAGMASGILVKPGVLTEFRRI